MRKLIFFFIIFIFVFLVFSEISFTQTNRILQIIGNAVDAETGKRIDNANITAIIEENGESENATVSSGTFNITINTTLNPNLEDFTIGLVLNTSSVKLNTSGKIGSYRILFRSGAGTSVTQSCTNKLWKITGTAIDPTTGDEITSGRITIAVDGTEHLNTTTFSNPIWTAYINPCLIYGRSYLFMIHVSDDGDRRGIFSFQQVHWNDS